MDTLIIILSLLLLFVIVPVVALLLFDRVTEYLASRRKPSPEEARAAEAAWVARLRNPAFGQLREYLGTSIPKSVRRLYAAKDLVLQDELYFPDPGDPGQGWHVDGFLPADMQTTEETFIEHEGPILPFARTITGGTYFIALAESTAEDGPVYLEDHGDIEKVCDSLETFVRGLVPPPE